MHKNLLIYKYISIEENLNIVNLIENFTEYQQQLFVSSFFCFLKYDLRKDFIVEFDNIWKWTGFSRKDHAKTLLLKYFVEDIDYKILLPHLQEQDFINGKKVKIIKKVKNKEENKEEDK